MRKIALLIIKFYKKCISPFLPNACRFYPTCSEYAYTSIERFGIIKGSFLAIFRLAKCQPFHKGGVDLVPEEFYFSELIKFKNWRNKK